MENNIQERVKEEAEKIVYCNSCNKGLPVPYSFIGTILCEDCDPFLKQQKQEFNEYDLEKLYEWLMDEKRKPAITAFTSGISRNIASEIEFRLWQKQHQVNRGEEGMRWVKANDMLPEDNKVRPPLYFKKKGVPQLGWYWSDKNMFVNILDDWFTLEDIEWLYEPEASSTTL